MTTALITGVTGQDGAYLAQLLLGKGYRVIGLMRRSASSDVIGERLRWLGILDQVELVDGNLTDISSLIRIIQQHKPDEIYNLAAQSFVAASWQQPLLTGTVTALGAGGAAGGTGVPGELVRDVRPDPGADAVRADAVLPAQPVRGGQAVRALDDGELPGELRAARVVGHPVQP